jgi:hypothetical protein
MVPSVTAWRHVGGIASHAFAILSRAQLGSRQAEAAQLATTTDALIAAIDEAEKS